MYSTLEDLLKFYEFLRSGKVLDEQHLAAFTQQSVNVDGSDRGFELFSACFPGKGEVYLFINQINNRDELRPLFRALESFARQ